MSDITEETIVTEKTDSELGFEVLPSPVTFTELSSDQQLQVLQGIQEKIVDDFIELGIVVAAIRETDDIRGVIETMFDEVNFKEAVLANFELGIMKKFGLMSAFVNEDDGTTSE